MDCFNCNNPYNDTQNCPRLLTTCGHSICAECLNDNFFQGAILCPECKAINEAPSIAAFPKNLALLNLKHSSIVGDPRLRQSNSSFDIGEHIVCTRHRKKVEAFCERERALLCIHCILEDKKKELEANSIPKSAEKERDLLNKGMELSKILEGKLEGLQQEVHDAYTKLYDCAEKSRKEITTFYNEIRRIIGERETVLKQKISEQFRGQENSLRQQEEKIIAQLQAIHALYDEIEKTRSESDVKMLSQSMSRMELLRKATLSLEDVSYYIPFEDFQPQFELANVLKLLTPIQNISVATPNPIKNLKQPKPTANRESLNKGQGNSGNGHPPIVNPYKVASSKKEGEKSSHKPKELRSKENEFDFKKTPEKKVSSPLRASINITPVQNQQQKAYYELRGSRKDQDDFGRMSDIEGAKSRNGSIYEHSPHRMTNDHPKVVTEKHDLKLNRLTHDTDLRNRADPNSESFCSNEDFLELLGQVGTKDGMYKGSRDVSKLDMSGIPTDGKGDKTDLTQNKEMKSFLVETASRSELSDITQQKLDFSVLCQQSNSYVYVMGGFVENEETVVERYDIHRGKWETACSMKSARTKFSSVALPNGNVLIMGGKQGSGRVSSCEELLIKENMIKPSEIVLPVAKSGFGTCLINDEMYISGGNDGNSILKNFDCYSLKKKQWISLPPLRTKRDEHAVTFGLDKKLYAIGGYGGPNNTCLNTVERYDFKTKTWEPVANLNLPRRALTAVTMPDGIYAIGGFDGENYLSTVERYDETQNEWVFVSSMNYPRCTFSAVASSDYQNIYVFGGFDNGPLNTAERYSVIRGTWEVIAPMKFKRFMHSSSLMITK